MTQQTPQQADSFLPPDYKEPAGKYMKFAPGENRLRVLKPSNGTPHIIIGNLLWRRDNTPVRIAHDKQFRDEDYAQRRNDDNGHPEKIKFFWAFWVYNYREDAIQVLEITQRSIQQAIRKLTENVRWGSPFGYDICIEKSGSGLDTEYNVIPEPVMPGNETLPDWVKDTFEGMGDIDLRRLYDGGDPFEKEQQTGHKL